MAGARKSSAILAAVMFAMLLSGSMVNGARPLGVDGGDELQPNGRQLRFFLGLFNGCGFLFRYNCGPRIVVVKQPIVKAEPVVVREERRGPPPGDDDDDRRKLMSVGSTEIQANGRQLNWFFHRKFDYGCHWWFFCHKRSVVVEKVPVVEEDDDRRKLMSVGSSEVQSHGRQLRFFGLLRLKKCFLFGCKNEYDSYGYGYGYSHGHGRRLNFFWPFKVFKFDYFKGHKGDGKYYKNL